MLVEIKYEIIYMNGTFYIFLDNCENFFQATNKDSLRSKTLIGCYFREFKNVWIIPMQAPSDIDRLKNLTVSIAYTSEILSIYN